MIPAEHGARLIALGDMVDLEGKLRMTMQGRIGYMLGNSLTEKALATNAAVPLSLVQLEVLSAPFAQQTGRQPRIDNHRQSA